MRDIYLKIEEKLKTIPALRWIDVDEGQLEFYDQKPPVAFPCALVDIGIVRTEDISAKRQVCHAQIRLRLAFTPLGQTNSSVPVLVKTKALSNWDTVSAVHATLQGFESDIFTELSRTSQQTEARPDPYKVVQMVYNSSFEEET